MTLRIVAGRRSSALDPAAPRPRGFSRARALRAGIALRNLLVVPVALAALAACGPASGPSCSPDDACSSGPGDDQPDGSTPLDAGGDATVGADGEAAGPDAAPLDGSAGASQDAAEDHAASSDDAAPLADSGPLCLPSQKVCGGVCVSVDDPSYGCTDTSCSPCALPNAQATCSAGACAVAQCTAGYVHCTGAAPGCETSITTPSACGSCTNGCASGSVCAEQDAGTVACTLACPSSAPTDCGGTCVDLATNVQHCGQCGVACDAPPTGGTSSCVNDTCVASCPSTPSTERLCGDACVDTATSNANCGACGASCAAPANATSAQCTSGQCAITCAAGYHLCSGACDPNTDLPTQDPCEVTETFGVFVSSSLGKDTTAGTRAAPFKTLKAAIAAAQSSGKRVYACAEAYGEATTLVSGVSIFGYFTCASGTWAVGSGHAVVSAPTSPAVTASNVTDVRLESIEWDAPSVQSTSSASSFAMTAVDSTLTLVNVDLVAGTAGSGAAEPGAAAPTGPSGSCPASNGAAAPAVANGSASHGVYGASGYAAGAGIGGAVGGNGANGTAGGIGECAYAQASCAFKTVKSGNFTTQVCEGPSSETACAGNGTNGCGGPGGAAGTGGTGGGSSVALFAWSSTVDVTGGELAAGNGGNGGPGVAGGVAPTTWPGSTGTAGTDALGTQSSCVTGDNSVNQATCSVSAVATVTLNGGAAGGSGGRGANGGNGAGGSGGDSYSYYQGTGATVSVDSTVTLKQGTAGAAGGGPIAGFAGTAAPHN